MVVLVNDDCGNNFAISLELVRDLLISWADNQYSSGMLQEALTSGCLGPTGKLGKNLVLVNQNINLGQMVISLKNHAKTLT